MKFPAKQTLQKSGILFSILFGIFFGILPYIFYSKIKSIVFLISLIIFLISFISPYSLRVPYLLWIRLGKLLGRINSNFILIFFFYIFITPVSIVRRFFFFIKKLFKRKCLSYYKKENLTDQINFRDQF
tara:strand:+ start:2649 stop:3035 length:387 start_codon:yes stop_codon:yes gene_type:complete